jgi:hypothetical protein
MQPPHPIEPAGPRKPDWGSVFRDLVEGLAGWLVRRLVEELLRRFLGA